MYRTFNPSTASIKEIEMHIKTKEQELKLLKDICKIRKEMEKQKA